VKETFREEKVTYTIEVDGQVVIVRNVPARVCLETGEKLFSLETVERLQSLIQGSTPPKQYLKSPVFEFA
jgi:YgiT-type zinc finger domain-containing protein